MLQKSVILSEVVVRKAHDNAVEGPAFFRPVDLSS